VVRVLDHLGRKVVEGAAHRSSKKDFSRRKQRNVIPSARGVHRPSEVGDLQGPIGADQDVLWLKVDREVAKLNVYHQP
jgi:hypothetical protein